MSSQVEEYPMWRPSQRECASISTCHTTKVKAIHVREFSPLTEKNHSSQWLYMQCLPFGLLF
jgi:hypothetical protein